MIHSAPNMFLLPFFHIGFHSFLGSEMRVQKKCHGTYEVNGEGGKR